MHPFITHTAFVFGYASSFGVSQISVSTCASRLTLALRIHFADRARLLTVGTRRSDLVFRTTGCICKSAQPINDKFSIYRRDMLLVLLLNFFRVLCWRLHSSGATHCPWAFLTKPSRHTQPPSLLHPGIQSGSPLSFSHVFGQWALHWSYMARLSPSQDFSESTKVQQIYIQYLEYIIYVYMINIYSIHV